MMSRFSNVFFGFINFMILIRILDEKTFGIWALYISVTTSLEMIKNGFIIGPMVRAAVIADKTEYARILSASLLLNIIVSVVQIMIVVGASFFMPEFRQSAETSSLLYFFVFTSLILVVVNHCNAIQQANYDFKADFFSNFTRQFSFFVGVIGCYFLGFKFSLIQLATLNALTISATACMAYFSVKKFISFSRDFSKRWMKELAQYGKYTFGTNISTTVLRNVDTWLLGYILGPVAVTMYNPALRVANIVEVPTVSLSLVFFPKLLARFGKEGASAAKEMYEKSVGALFAFMLPIVLICVIFAEPIILIIAGPKFVETVFILRVVMLTGLILPFNRQVGITLDAIGKAKTNFYIVLRNAAMNIIATYIYISYFGVIGAAYGLLTTFTISFIFNQIYIRYLLKVSFLNIFKNAFSFQKQFLQFAWQTVTRTGKA